MTKTNCKTDENAQKMRLMNLLSKITELKEIEGLEEIIADHLLSHGVMVPEVFVGDTIYGIYMSGINRRGKLSRCRLTKRCEFAGKNVSVKAMKCCSSYINFIGKTVFLTREEAEKAIEIEREKKRKEKEREEQDFWDLL